jgi:hypothetical protein
VIEIKYRNLDLTDAHGARTNHQGCESPIVSSLVDNFNHRPWFI